jgi:hypothetical protein
MRREVFALAMCACGTSTPATSTFDSGRDEPAVKDFSPGPDDAVDASAPTGIACTPGSVRVVAMVKSFVDDGPRVDDGFVYWTQAEPDADADVLQGYWWAGFMTVLRADKLGESPTRLFGTSSIVRRFDALPFLQVDETNAYWIDYTAAGFGDIVRGAKDGSSQQALVSGVPTPRELEIAGDTLFFESGSSLYSIGVDGSNERVVRETWSATEYAVGATHVYAIDQGRVVSVTRTGEILEPLVEQTPDVAYEGLSVGDDGYVYAIQLIEKGGFVMTANVLRIATDGKTPAIVVPDVQSDFPPSQRLFTTTDGPCLVYTTSQGVFRRCGATNVAIGPNAALEAPVVDSTSIYWRAQTDASTTVIYAACKM